MAKKHLSPHDRYVRSSLTTPQVAQEFFKAHLPAQILSSLDLSTLEPQKESFIGDDLRLGIVDLLYSVKFHGEPGYIYILMEHASSPDKLLAFRLLKYALGIMDFHLKKTGETKLPFIYPLVLYTGKKPYPYSTDLFDLFGQDKELARETLLSPFHLIDLTQVSDEELSHYIWFGIAGLIAKHIYDPDILPIFKNNVIYLMQEVEKHGEFSYIYKTLTYIVEAGEVKNPDEFVKTVLEGLSEIEEEKVMTIAEHWKHEGVSLCLTAIQLLKKGYTYQQVTDETGLSTQEIKNIEKSLSH